MCCAVCKWQNEYKNKSGAFDSFVLRTKQMGEVRKVHSEREIHAQTDWFSYEEWNENMTTYSDMLAEGKVE